MSSAATSPLNIETPGAAGTGRARWLLAATPGLCYLSIGCWPAVLPGWVLHHLGATSTELGIVMGATPVAAVLLRPRAGALGDRLGFKLPAFTGAVLLGLGAVVLLGPPSLALVVASRLLLGVGDALFATAVFAWAIDGVPANRHGRTLSAVGMGIWLGTALGPQWSTLVREHLGYNAVWIGAALAPALAAAVVAVVPLAPRARRARAEPARFKLPRGAILPSAAMMLAVYGDGIFAGFGIVHLTNHGLPSRGGIGGAASVFTVIAITTFVARFLGGWLADKFSPRLVAASGAVTVACGYALMAVVTSFGGAALAAVLVGLGLALLYPATGVIVSTGVRPDQRGAGFGVFLASLDVAFGLGPALGGLIVSAASTEAALLSGTCLALVAAPLLLVSQRQSALISIDS